jgi:hypothetical protein
MTAAGVFSCCDESASAALWPDYAWDDVRLTPQASIFMVHAEKI